MPINNISQYRNLPRIHQLQAGDLLLKKAFPETCKGAVEWGITNGQKLFSGDKYTTRNILKYRNMYKITFNGSPTSEHAAVAIAHDEVAEAIGEGVITGSITGRREERYCIYRCQNTEVRDAAVMIAKGMSNVYHNIITGNNRMGQSTGGKYSITGALTSNVRGKTFSHSSTNNYLTQIIDYVYGLHNNRPNMFCSEFAIACYEAGSVVARGKTAFGTNPRGMSPMVMEDTLNNHSELMTLVGKYDSEDDPIYSAVDAGLHRYNRRWHWNASKASKNAKKILHNLLLIGDNDYLLAAVAALLNTQPTAGLRLRCIIPNSWRLSPDSSLYGDLRNELRAKAPGLFII